MPPAAPRRDAGDLGSRRRQPLRPSHTRSGVSAEHALAAAGPSPGGERAVPPIPALAASAVPPIPALAEAQPAAPARSIGRIVLAVVVLLLLGGAAAAWAVLRIEFEAHDGDLRGDVWYGMRVSSIDPVISKLLPLLALAAAGCASSPTLRAAEQGRFEGLRDALGAEMARGALHAGEAARFARAVTRGEPPGPPARTA